jgi:hypothetical protein
VVVEINVFRLAAAADPSKDQPLLTVYADRVESCQLAAQFLEVIAGWHAQVLIRRRVIDHLQFPEQTIFEIGRNIPRSPVFDKKGVQPLVPEVHDQGAIPLCINVPPLGTQYKSRGDLRPLRGEMERHRYAPMRDHAYAKDFMRRV